MSPHIVISNSHGVDSFNRVFFPVVIGPQLTHKLTSGTSRSPWIIWPYSEWMRPVILSSSEKNFCADSIRTSNKAGSSWATKHSNVPDMQGILTCQRSLSRLEGKLTIPKQHVSSPVSANVSSTNSFVDFSGCIMVQGGTICCVDTGRHGWVCPQSWSLLYLPMNASYMVSLKGPIVAPY